MNLFRDNADLQFHFKHGVRWERSVPAWEDGFVHGDQDGPRSLQEAVELYEATLAEVGEFAAREIAPTAREIDEQGVSFRDGEVIHPAALLRNIEGLKKLGVIAPSLPREVGGFNFPYTVTAMLVEVIGRACTNTQILYGFHQLPALMVLRFGTPDQIERWVKPAAEGRLSGSIAITEADAGSDVGNLSASAVEAASANGRHEVASANERHGQAGGAPQTEGAGWRVSGRKQFITNGCGDVCIALVRTEPGSKGLKGLSLVVVPRVIGGKPNYAVAKPEKKFTIRGSATCELAFDGSCAELLGPRGNGFAEVLTFMNEARVGVAIQGLSLSQNAVDLARAYAERRVQMGRPIAKHELVADLLLDMEAELAAMRALVYRCTAAQDRLSGLERPGAKADPRELARLKRELRDRTPLVKWFGSERTLWITRAAVQVHGGYGVVQDYDVERLYRNALILPIYEGTSQIQALMSLKDQAKWALERPWRLLTGAVSVEATPDALGDALREMAGEYNRTLRYVLKESIGLGGLLRGLLHRESGPEQAQLSFALLQAERLAIMLAYARAAEALVAHAGSAPHRRLAERFVHRSLPLLRMHAEIVRSGDRSTLEAVRG